MRQTTVLALLLGGVLTPPISGAVITVGDDCTLVDAILAANTDAVSGGCPTGSEADEIHLTEDVLLTEVYEGSNGLPTVESEIDIVGNGYSVGRAPGAPPFRLFTVQRGGDLGIYSTAIVRGALPLAPGGAIANFDEVLDNRLAIVNSTLSGTTRGAVNASLSTTLSVRNSVFSGNRYALYVDSPLGEIRDTQIFDNWASSIFLHSAVAESFPISHSAIYDNGWGVQVHDGMLRNTTISGNGRSNTMERLAYVVGSTIVGQSELGLRSIEAYYTARVRVADTIVAGNGTDCDLNADWIDHGGILDSDGTCFSATPIEDGYEPLLADNGGTTPSHALRAGSPAIGAGQWCANAVDQRGIPRDPDACDSGAVSSAPLELELSSTGLCPGEITGEVVAATPGARVAVAISEEYGPDEVPAGICAGTRVGLAEPALLAVVVADESGVAPFSFDSRLDQCGDLMQAVDLADCTISDADTVGKPPPPPPCTQPAACGLDRLRLGVPRALRVPAPAGDQHLVGDWDGDGCDNVAIRTGNTVLFDTNFDLLPELRQIYGRGESEDEYLVGDWNGDGCDDLAVRRDDLLLMDVDFDGSHDLTAAFGPGVDADEYLIGDIDGRGRPAIIFRDGVDLFWDLAPWDSRADGSTRFGGGDNEDQYLVGHWSDDGTVQQTFAVRRGDQVLMNYDLDGVHDFVQTFGPVPADEYLAGDWDGDGRDNLAVRSGEVIEMDTDFDSETDIALTYGVETPPN